MSSSYFFHVKEFDCSYLQKVLHALRSGDLLDGLVEQDDSKGEVIELTALSSSHVGSYEAPADSTKAVGTILHVSLFCLDEPTSSSHDSLAERIAKVLKELREERQQQFAFRFLHVRGSGLSLPQFFAGNIASASRKLVKSYGEYGCTVNHNNLCIKRQRGAHFMLFTWKFGDGIWDEIDHQDLTSLILSLLKRPQLCLLGKQIELFS